MGSLNKALARFALACLILMLAESLNTSETE
jgi:hypothetical protein